MSAEARQRLATQQAQLLAALTGRADPPEGFERKRVLACRQALLNKRIRSAARAWPVLVRSLGEEGFRERFRSFALTSPLPGRGGPLADGYRFAHQLLRTEGLADAARAELREVDLRYRRVRDGLVPRRWPSLRSVWIRFRSWIVNRDE